MKVLPLVLAVAILATATPAFAEQQDLHGQMPAMAMPEPDTADPTCPPDHAAMGHCTPKSPGNADGNTGTEDPMASGGTALPAGDAPAPLAVPADYADRIWGADAMAPARAAVMKEHGDINRFTIKSEGEGAFGAGAEQAEIQALYSRVMGPYFNLQGGIRHDFQAGARRTCATIGFEGLAPYWFDVEGAVFRSDQGDLLARLEGYYDQRITQRLVLQPRAEVNLSAQDSPANGVGSGLVDAELGLRLRYEITREFAPYVGMTWERKFASTARFARANGEGTGGFGLVAGVRIWF